MEASIRRASRKLQPEQPDDHEGPRTPRRRRQEQAEEPAQIDEERERRGAGRAQVESGERSHEIAGPDQQVRGE
jgi:hypothetical protein